MAAPALILKTKTKEFAEKLSLKDADLRDNDESFKELQDQVDRLAVCAPEVFPDGKTVDDVLSGYEISLVWSLCSFHSIILHI